MKSNRVATITGKVNHFYFVTTYSCQAFFSTPASSLYDVARFGGNNAAMMESMGAQLKQKEGELLQLQVLMSEQSKVKEAMTRELTRLTILADQVWFINEDDASMNL